MFKLPTNYKEKFIYDSNGNILSLLRYAEGTNPMDNLTYHYNPGTNQLQFVDDAIADGDYTVDIDDQDTLNYSYDKNGNLVFDAAEEIDTIRWTVSGKIEAVIRASASTKPSLYFYYDALGNRSIKQVVPASGTQTFEFYKRDATGNILATYKMADSSGTKILKLEQREIYGSSRLGVITQEVRIAENAAWPSVLPTYDTANAPFVLWNADSTYQDSVFINPFDSVGYKIKVNKYLGYRNYELSNHLGNVLAVISDRKYGEDANTDGELELFRPKVLSETDYYAFGAPMPGRNFNANAYRYGYGNQEMDNEIKGVGNSYSFTHRIFDSRLGRFLSVDPIAPYFPWLSTYQFAGNNPIMNIDLEGLEPHSVHKIKKRKHPRITNDFTGRNLFDKLFGNDSRGKYTPNVNHHNNRVPKPRPNDNVDGDGTIDPPNPRTKDKPEDDSNPLKRDSENGEDLTIYNRREFTVKYNEGTVTVDFDQVKDESGNPVDRTIEIGILDKDGNERTLNKITTKESGSLSSDFKLGEGEKLFTRQTGGEGNANTTATKQTEVEEE